jgi:cobalamin biosynthesis Mg chelatase CobN
MIRAYAKWKAKLEYVLKEEKEAAVLELNARAAQYHAGKRREEIKKLTAEADAIEASIKRVDELQEKGYWLCENGHEEPQSTAFAGVELEISRTCSTCAKPMKLIRRDLMSRQEQYKSAKERKEAQQMADANRKAVKDHEEQIKGHEDTARTFRAQVQRTREFAELLRKL